MDTMRNRSKWILKVETCSNTELMRQHVMHFWRYSQCELRLFFSQVQIKKKNAI